MTSTVGGSGDLFLGVRTTPADGADPTNLLREENDHGRSRARHLAAPRPVVSNDVEGTASQVAEQLLEFGRAGTDEFILRDQASGVSIAAATDLIDMLTQEVLPLIKT